MPTDQIRLLIAEDVPQVTAHIRNLLSVQSQIKLLDVVADGNKAFDAAGQLRPDAILVDILLQGKLKGPQLIEKLKDSGLDIPVVVLTVPQTPVLRNPQQGIDAVLTLPFSGFELVNTLVHVLKDREAKTLGACKVISVFSPKGGVGKTTLAFNLAVALAQLGVKTVLIDGSMQYGDLRALLKVSPEIPSILDLPTDRVQQSDLNDVLWRDPAGIDILLAPPRVEMAEMVTTRDVEKIISILRRLYQAMVIDTPTSLSDVTLCLLDASDLLLQVVTYDSTTLHNTLAVARAFASIGYGPEKLKYVVNRSDSTGGVTRDDLARTLGRAPEFEIVSDGRLVMQTNNEGLPFVVSNPEATISKDVLRMAAGLVGQKAAAGRR